MLLGVQFARTYWATGSKSAILLSAVAIFCLLQLACEVSRSLVAYSYDWHLIRSLGIWFFAGLSGLSINLLVFHRSSSRLLVPWLVAVVVAIILVTALTHGFDNRTVLTLNILAITPLLAGAISLLKKPPDLLLMAVGALSISWYVIGGISPTVLLDSGFYITNVMFLSMVWFWISHDREGSNRTREAISRPESSYFYVKHTGRVERIPADNVLYLRAAGNYTELVCADGRIVLHHQRLGQIMEPPPSGFLRVHRSHALNLNKVRGLRSSEGSRYHAELEDGQRVSVSRYYAKAIRDFLGASS